MGFLDKFKKKKEKNIPIPVPKVEETKELQGSSELRNKLDDIPISDIPPALQEPEKIEEPKAEDFGVPEEAPKSIEGLSLPEFEKEDAAKLPEEIPFDEISSGSSTDEISSGSSTDKISSGSLTDEESLASEEPTLPEAAEVPMSETPKEQREVADKIFIKVSDYQDILKNIANIKKEVKTSKNNIEDIVKNINFENKDISKVKESLSSIQKSIINVDDELFEK